MNALKPPDWSRQEIGARRETHQWLERIIFGYKAVFSSSPHHEDYLEESEDTSNRVMHVNGGLTRVSYLEIYSQ